MKRYYVKKSASLCLNEDKENNKLYFQKRYLRRKYSVKFHLVN